MLIKQETNMTPAEHIAAENSNNQFLQELAYAAQTFPGELKKGSKIIFLGGDASSATEVVLVEKDYIVEQGTSGILTYRKWASGMAEMWGTAELKNKTQSPEQLLCFDMNLPWTQVEGEYPAGIVTPRNLEESYILRESAIHYFTWYAHNENRIRFGAIGDDKSWEIGTEVSVSIIVKGRWK